MKNKDPKKIILNTLSEKANIKQKVYDKTLAVFKMVKKVLKTMVTDYNKQLTEVDPRVLLEFKDISKFEAELKVAGDLLIFNMHSNIFEFDREHGVWKKSYVKDNPLNSYAGIINIYNFLSDSFKYNRLDDLGYLVARIFINRENHYFVEGKRQLGFLYNNFGEAVINKKAIQNIIESAILYTLDFDLLVPPYNDVKFASVSQMKDKINKSKVKTGKRIGFQFYTDDVGLEA